MTTTETYRRLRAEDPYMGARMALSIARADTAADAAGLPRWLDEDPCEVVIDGESFTLEMATDEALNAHGWDCLGHVHERRRHPYDDRPDPVAWPCVPLPAGYDDSGTQGGYYHEFETYYDPGDSWEPFAPFGMARGPAHDWVRAHLIAEGVRVRKAWTYGATLTDQDGNDASLWGIDLANDGGPTDRSYLWSMVDELAYEIRHERAERAEKAARETFHRLTMASPHG